MSRRYVNVLSTKSGGFSLLGWLLMIPAAIVALPILVFGFYEGRKAYWDAKVREMCEKDGGVRILERVRISKADVEVLGHNNGKISVPIKEAAPRNAPVYSEMKTTHLREWNPEVWRREVSVVRREDQKVVAAWVSYSRVGGDFPTFAHPSSRGCPDLRRVTSDLEHLFIVEGDSK